MDDMAQKNHATLPADFVIGCLLLKITHMSSLDQPSILIHSTTES
ncbi:unnamed protein product [Brassica oleracea]